MESLENGAQEVLRSTPMPSLTLTYPHLPSFTLTYPHSEHLWGTHAAPEV